MNSKQDRRESRRDREQQLAIHRLHVSADLKARVITSLVKFGSLVLIVYFITDAAKEYAGKITIADMSIVLSAMLNQHLAMLLSAALGIGGITYGRYQWKIRKDTVEVMHKYQRLWEEQVDPGRTSSNLTPRGETPNGDD